MNQLHGDSEYADVMERVLYNGFLHGIGIDGDSLLYTNPLQGRASRFSWHNCACCPPNVARTIASVSEYAYVQAGKMCIRDSCHIHRFRLFPAFLAIGTADPAYQHPW